MAEKETSKIDTSQKVMTKYDKKVQKRKEEELKRKQEKKIARITGIVILAVILIGLLSIPVRKYMDTHGTYIKVGDHNVTKVEFDYYYNLAYKNYVNNYGSYLSYFGLDTTKDFSKQSYDEDLTWKDYFDQLAVDTMRQNRALCEEAKANGFEYDTKADFTMFIDNARLAASESKVTLAKYLKDNFGEYATEDSLKPFAEENYIAAAYYDSIAETKKASTEEIKTYYDEHKADYDSVDYLITEIAADIPEAKTVTDGDGNASTVQPTDEEITAAMTLAKKDADKALEVIATEGTEKTGMLKASTSTKYNEWLFDDARKADDTNIVEDETNHKYYVLQFKNRYLNEAKLQNIRAILTSKMDGNDIINEWKEAGSSEEAFIGLAAKYSEDTYTSGNGGLYDDLAASSLSKELQDWLYDPTRKEGDVTSITIDTYTYVLYYLNEGTTEWENKIQTTLQNAAMSEWLDEQKSTVTISDPGKKLKYLQVEAKKEAEATAAPVESSSAATEQESSVAASTEPESSEVQE